MLVTTCFLYWFVVAVLVFAGRAMDDDYTGTFEDAARDAIFWPIRFVRWFAKSFWQVLRNKSEIH